MVQVKYPSVLSEEATLKMVAAGASCSRFGDGELRLCLTGTAISQVANDALRAELCSILAGPCASLVCIPHFSYGPKVLNWQKYGAPKFTALMKQKLYGSAFITRPDSAPDFSTPEYWTRVRSIWKDRDVTLVVGSSWGSLDNNMLRDAKSLRLIMAPRRDAYEHIDALEGEIGNQPIDHPVIMCLGATATCLAERLARKGMWGLDLGHIGRFMPEEFR